MKEGWEYKIFESCLVKVPKQVQIKSKDYKKEGKFPIVSQEAELISGYWDDETIVYKHKEPVVIFGDHTKNIKYVDFNFVVGADGTHILSTKKDINPKFFYYVLKSIKLRELGYARHYKLLKEKYIPVPPLSEQQSIVDYLDSAFAKIDAMKANAEKALNEAKALFQASLKEMLEPKEGWEEKKLGDICDFRSGFAFKSNKFTKIGEPIIRISDIQNEEIDDSNLVYFDSKSYTEDLSKYLIYPDDILIAMSGGTTGKLGINTSNRTFYLNQRVGVFRENKSYLNHRYLYHYLHTKSEESLRIAAGAAQPNLSTAQIKSFIIPVPSLSEQRSIVATLDSIKSKVDKLQANYEKISQECDALKQAILRQVFE